MMAAGSGDAGVPGEPEYRDGRVAQVSSWRPVFPLPTRTQWPCLRVKGFANSLRTAVEYSNADARRRRTPAVIVERPPRTTVNDQSGARSHRGALRNTGTATTPSAPCGCGPMIMDSALSAPLRRQAAAGSASPTSLRTSSLPQAFPKPEPAESIGLGA